MGGQDCYNNMSYGFYDLRNMQYDFSHWAKIKEIFNICDDLASPEEIEAIIGILSDSIGTMAIVNYPYATNFVNPLPAWPIQESCKAASMVTPE